MLNPDSPMPLYQQLADELSEQIRAGAYAPGSKIPSEHELASRYALGRPTVRQATEVLVRKRVLERRRGSGTFVTDALPEVDLFSLGGTLASFRRSGLTLSTRWLQRVRRASVDAAAGLPFSGRDAYYAARVGSVRGEAVLVERFYFDPQTFPDLDRESPGPAASLSAHIESRYNARPTGGRQTFRVRAADPETAATLKLDPGIPVLEVKRTLDFPRAVEAIHVIITCNTQNLVFAQDLGDLSNA